ncbi:MAG: hypothetical protein U0793_30520 [Gemmataceae bacterium]
MVQALPVLSVLRRLPAAHIAWVISELLRPLLEGIRTWTRFCRSIASWRRGVTNGFAATLRFFRLLRRAFDLVIDLQCLLRARVQLGQRARSRSA